MSREAFAAWLPLGGVPASYAVAVGYVVTDTIDKGFKAYAQAREELEGNESLPIEVNSARYVQLGSGTSQHTSKLLLMPCGSMTADWPVVMVIMPFYSINPEQPRFGVVK